jgi:hypothetical protein
VEVDDTVCIDILCSAESDRKELEDLDFNGDFDASLVKATQTTTQLRPPVHDFKFNEDVGFEGFESNVCSRRILLAFPMDQFDIRLCDSSK